MIYFNKSSCLTIFVLLVWTISLSAQTFKKDAITAQVEGGLRPLTITPLKERDVSWEQRVWRDIALNELANHHFAKERMPFIKVLTDAALNGNIQAYSNIDDAFTTLLTVEDFKELFYSIDTLLCCFGCEVYSIDNISIIRNEMNPTDVVRYRIKEVWYFDENIGRMDVQILGIAPIVSKFDDNGNFLAAVPMCWFHYDEIRDHLAKTKAPNPYNDHGKISWDDVFLSRRFSSYIIKKSRSYRGCFLEKEDPVYNFLEANNISSRFFNFEQDLFSY